MKHFFLGALILLSLSAYSQLLNPSKEWFTQENFFSVEEISKQKIKKIIVYKQSKKDGKIFKDEYACAEYIFNENGFLKQAFKYTPGTVKDDTSIYSFYYNNSNQVYKRSEKQGPFNFIYYQMYKDKKPIKEVKIDGNSENLDTAYIHHLDYKFLQADKYEVNYFNSVNKPFKSIKVEKDLFDQVILHETNYERNANFTRIKYDYNLNQLNSKLIESSYGRTLTSTDWQFKYKNGFIDLVEKSVNEKLKLKYGILYKESHLIDAVVERNIANKSVTIYKLQYEFYN